MKPDSSVGNPSRLARRPTSVPCRPAPSISSAMPSNRVQVAANAVRMEGNPVRAADYTKITSVARGRRLRPVDPCRNAIVENVERQRPTIQDLVVERADVELRTQRILGALAQFEQLQLTQLVPQRLA